MVQHDIERTISSNGIGTHLMAPFFLTDFHTVVNPSKREVLSKEDNTRWAKSCPPPSSPLYKSVLEILFYKGLDIYIIVKGNQVPLYVHQLRRRRQTQEILHLNDVLRIKMGTCVVNHFQSELNNKGVLRQARLRRGPNQIFAGSDQTLSGLLAPMWATCPYMWASCPFVGFLPSCGLFVSVCFVKQNMDLHLTEPK